MQELYTELEIVVNRLDKNNESKTIQKLDALFPKYGSKNAERWQNRSNNKNSLLHEFVEHDMIQTIRHVLTKYEFDVNVRRATDGSTPYDLATTDQKEEICKVLEEFLEKRDAAGEGDGHRWRTDEEKLKSMNIIWLDLEMTSIEEPEIMECAVIITDSELKPLEEGNWVIHFEQSVLDTLGPWHQKTFADRKDGGNNLFADVLKSKLTKDEVEEDLLALIQRHCPPKMCSLAGSSIHIDKRVLEQQMPKVHDYLHYRIIDVSSFQAIMKRWAPWLERKIKDRVARNGSDNVNHRAMDDIIWSISFMREMRPLLNQLGPGNVSNNKGHGSRDRHHRIPHQRSNSDSGAASNMILPKINRDMLADMELYTDERRLLERIEYENNFDWRSLKLPPKWQQIYDENPHLRELFINSEQIQAVKGDFTKHSRVLELSPQPSLKNSSNPYSKKITTTEHWGQRKLLLPEIEFLTKYGTDPDHRVVYAGAAPGIHIIYLASLFPKFEFILIDDKDFSIKAGRNVKIIQEKFSDDLAKRYCSTTKKVLFICNVRTFQPQQYASNSAPCTDMEDQTFWFRMLKPHVALLYFRLPRESGKTKFLKGTLIIEPWASRKSMECRLVVKKDAPQVDYDHQAFANALLHFQNVTRVSYYEHDMDDVPNEGLDHCYDCRAEIFIIQEYLKQVEKVKSDSKLKQETAMISKEISKQIIDKNRKSIINVPRTLDVIPKRSSSVSTSV